MWVFDMILALWRRWRNWRRFKQRMAVLRKRDPFIYR
jgi:hypothetical protein